MKLDDMTLPEKVAMLVRTLQSIDPALDENVAIDKAIALVGDTCQLEAMGLTAKSYSAWADLIKEVQVDLDRYTYKPRRRDGNGTLLSLQAPRNPMVAAQLGVGLAAASIGMAAMAGMAAKPPPPESTKESFMRSLMGGVKKR